MNKFEVPAGLSFMLRDFTIAVLKQKPSDLYRFAADYFKRMADERSAEEAGSIAEQIGAESQLSTAPTAASSADDVSLASDGSLAKKKVAMFVVVDNDAEACEPDPVSFQPKKKNHNNSSDTDDSRDDDSGDKHGGLHRNFGRRRSVAAERYDPEQDEDDDEDESSKKVTHPKTDEQRKRLKEAVQGILLFRSLEPEQINDVIDAMFERHVDPGDHVIRQGDDGDNFYVIDCGIYDVFFKSEASVAGSSSPSPTATTTAAPVAAASSATSVDRFVHRFEHSGSFGELALMYNQPRSASVLAVTKGRLWAMDRRSFRRIILRSAWRKRKAYEALLETVPMLQYLDPYERMNLADALSAVYFKEDDCIIKEGDPADGMYFIESGEVRVTITRNREETEVSRMKAGSYFGEMALVEKVPRSASVYASSETVKLAFLEVDCFERLLGPCLEIMKRNITNYVKSS